MSSSSAAAAAVAEGDILLDMFQKEFQKMHSELIEKEVRLFHHMFHHLFSSRLAKLEQFLKGQYDEFDDFEPDYAPISTNKSNPQETSLTKRMTRTTTPKTTTSSTRIIKQETPDFFEMEDDDEQEIFSAVYESSQVVNPLDIEDFMPGDDDSNNSGSSAEDAADGFTKSSCGGRSSRKRRRKRIKAGGTNNSNNEEDGGEEGVEAGGKTGRRRLPIWECYNFTFSSKGKVIKNDCKGCGEAVSPKASRMQLHALKCPEIQQAVANNNPSFIMSREVMIHLQRCQAKFAKENAKAGIKSNLPNSSLFATPNSTTNVKQSHYSSIKNNPDPPGEAPFIIIPPTNSNSSSSSTSNLHHASS